MYDLDTHIITTTLITLQHNPGKIYRERLGARLFNLAVQWSKPGGMLTTKVSQVEAIKAIKGRKRTSPVTSINKTVNEVLKAAEAIRDARRIRDEHKKVSGPQNSHRRIFPISKIPARHRVQSWSEARTIKALEEVDPIRGEEAPGGYNQSVVLTDDPTKVGYECETWANWDVYRGAFKGWKATGVTKRITVSRDWYQTVFRPGLSLVDGLLTLDARGVTSPIEDVRVYAAVWVEQGRGYSVHVKRGYIAFLADVSYHGETLDKAVKGVIRKVRRQGEDPEIREARAQKRRIQKAHRLAERWGDEAVSLDDSYAVGNCESGTLSWCAAVGIDPDQGATVSEVVAGYLMRPEPEAWAVLRHVEKRLRG